MATKKRTVKKAPAKKPASAKAKQASPVTKQLRERVKKLQAELKSVKEKAKLDVAAATSVAYQKGVAEGFKEADKKILEREKFIAKEVEKFEKAYAKKTAKKVKPKKRQK